jgi:hypothetical protein
MEQSFAEFLGNMKTDGECESSKQATAGVRGPK